MPNLKSHHRQRPTRESKGMLQAPLLVLVQVRVKAKPHPRKRPIAAASTPTAPTLTTIPPMAKRPPSQRLCAKPTAAAAAIAAAIVTATVITAEANKHRNQNSKPNSNPNPNPNRDREGATLSNPHPEPKAAPQPTRSPRLPRSVQVALRLTARLAPQGPGESGGRRKESGLSRPPEAIAMRRNTARRQEQRPQLQLQHPPDQLPRSFRCRRGIETLHTQASARARFRSSSRLMPRRIRARGARI
mmetsp:Transcript_14482/g.26037  ORF Transcript_14482/g.26037 Transcript_14482/m.26037 type:complete len:245 (+) Transcript_14482:1518-2252(+)